MFRVLLAHLQEALYQLHLVYCVRVMSVGCTRTGVELQSWRTTRTQYLRILSTVAVAPPEVEQVMLETYTGS
jgi:hypothetical protein